MVPAAEAGFKPRVEPAWLQACPDTNLFSDCTTTAKQGKAQAYARQCFCVFRLEYVLRSELKLDTTVDRESGLLVVVEAQARAKTVGRRLREFGDLLAGSDGLADGGGIVAVELVPGERVVGCGTDIACHTLESTCRGIKNSREFGGKWKNLGAIAEIQASGFLSEVG